MILHGSSALFAWLTEELHHITDLGQNGMGKKNEIGAPNGPRETMKSWDFTWFQQEKMRNSWDL